MPRTDANLEYLSWQKIKKYIICLSSEGKIYFCHNTNLLQFILDNKWIKILPTGQVTPIPVITLTTWVMSQNSPTSAFEYC